MTPESARSKNTFRMVIYDEMLYILNAHLCACASVGRCQAWGTGVVICMR